jgi:hypothetical protein
MPGVLRPSGRNLVPGADAEMRPAATLRDFAIGWNEVTTRYLPQSDKTRLPWPVSVTPAVHDWVNGLYEQSGPVKAPENVYTVAMLCGSFALYSALNRRNMHLRTPKGQEAALPRMSDYVGRRINPTVRALLTPRTWSVASWAHFDGGHANWEHVDIGFLLGKRDGGAGGGGPAPEHIVHAGVHILGALTLMPEGSTMTVRDGTQVFQLPVPLVMAGEQPFPADIARSFTPPNPE